jgi:hypothetical protein
MILNNKSKENNIITQYKKRTKSSSANNIFDANEAKVLALVNRLYLTRYLRESLDQDVNKEYIIFIDDKPYGRIMHGTIKTGVDDTENIIDFLDVHYRNKRSVIVKHIMKTLGIKEELS